MSSGDRFRIVTPTLAVASEAGQRVIVTVPKDAIIRVLSGPLQDERMVDVQWQGRRLLMFAQDLRERGRDISTGPVRMFSKEVETL